MLRLPQAGDYIRELMDRRLGRPRFLLARLMPTSVWGRVSGISGLAEPRWHLALESAGDRIRGTPNPAGGSRHCARNPDPADSRMRT